MSRRKKSVVLQRVEYALYRAVAAGANPQRQGKSESSQTQECHLQSAESASVGLL